MADVGTRQVFANLGVEDLKRSMAFFSAVGFRFGPKFTAACMIAGPADRRRAEVGAHDGGRG